jgi:hypothetical protein
MGMAVGGGGVVVVVVVVAVMIGCRVGVLY